MGDERKSSPEWNPDKILDLSKRTVQAASYSANEANRALGLIEVDKLDPNVAKLLEEVLASVDCLIQVNRYLISLIESTEGRKV